MKKQLLLALFSISLNSLAASDKLLLDASCKISCQTFEVRYGEGNPRTIKNTSTLYKDFTALTRQDLDSSLRSSITDKICKNSFGSSSSTENIDCLYFKN